MALNAADSLASFDWTTGRLDLEPVLAMVLLTDTALMGLIGMGPKALATTHKWNEDDINPVSLTGAESAEYSATDVTLDVTDGSKIRIGTLLKDRAAGKTEVIQVTAISTNALTVTRGYGTTDGETHAAAAEWLIVGQPVQQGDETIADISAVPTQSSNYTQIFKRTVKVGGSMQAEAQNGIHPGVPDQLKYQIGQRTLEMKREMSITLIHSIISATPSDTVYGTIKGLREFLTASGGNSLSNLGQLIEKQVNKLYRQSYDDGGTPSVLVGGPDQITQFSLMNAGKVRIAPSERVAGLFVNKFLTDLGQELELLIDRWFQSDEVALLDKSRAWYSPLQTREMFSEPLAKSGDAFRWQLIAEGTLVVKNATKAHAYATALTVPA